MTTATTAAIKKEDNIQPVLRQVQEAVRSLAGAPNLNIEQPTRAELRRRAEAHGFQTQFGSYAFGSMVKSRSAGLTVYVGSAAVQLPKPSARQQEILRQVPQTLELRGAVVWSQLQAAAVTEVGIEFIGLTLKQQAQIDQLVSFLRTRV